MKRFITLLMVLLLALSLTACGGGDENIESPAADPSAAEDPGVTAEPEIEGEVIDTDLWSLVYDDETWVYDTEYLYTDETYSNIIMEIPGPDDTYIVNAEIRVAIDDANYFRDYLDGYGFDQYEYAVNNAYETVNVGGLECLVNEGEYWGEPCIRYFGRDEGASLTAFVEIIGEYDDARVADWLSGITLKIEDIGNTDFPWHWDGEPFSSDGGSVMVGTYTLNSEWIPFDEYVRTTETFEHAAAVSGGSAYILSDGQLREFAFDGQSLTYTKDIELDGEFDGVAADNDGTIWISGFMEPLTALENGAAAAAYEGTDSVSMHPSGEWGVSYFTDPECRLITIEGDTISTTPITFDAVDMIMHLNVGENYIFVSGSDISDPDEPQRVFVYSKDGTLQKTLSGVDGDSLGSITFMAETPNGFIGLDGNMREVLLWTKDGTCIGSADDTDLFDTNYPWFCGGTMLDDGSLFLIMTDERADESATELLAFKLSGF